MRCGEGCPVPTVSSGIGISIAGMISYGFSDNTNASNLGCHPEVFLWNAKYMLCWRRYWRVGIPDVGAGTGSPRLTAPGIGPVPCSSPSSHIISPS